jgi:hypothetical protein
MIAWDQKRADSRSQLSHGRPGAGVNWRADVERRLCCMRSAQPYKAIAGGRLGTRMTDLDHNHCGRAGMHCVQILRPRCLCLFPAPPVGLTPAWGRLACWPAICRIYRQEGQAAPDLAWTIGPGCCPGDQSQLAIHRCAYVCPLPPSGFPGWQRTA